MKRLIDIIVKTKKYYGENARVNYFGNLLLDENNNFEGVLVNENNEYSFFVFGNYTDHAMNLIIGNDTSKFIPQKLIAFKIGDNFTGTVYHKTPFSETPIGKCSAEVIFTDEIRETLETEITVLENEIQLQKEFISKIMSQLYDEHNINIKNKTKYK